MRRKQLLAFSKTIPLSLNQFGSNFGIVYECLIFFFISSDLELVKTPSFDTHNQQTFLLVTTVCSFGWMLQRLLLQALANGPSLL